MPMKRKAIAVIDDSLGILGAMRRLLSALGYDTELFASAKEFLDARMMTEAFCLVVDIDIGDSCGSRILIIFIRISQCGAKGPAR